RPAAGRRHRGQVPGGGAGAAQGEEASVERSLLGRWHADRGLGLDEERQAQGQLGRAASQGGGRNAEADFKPRTVGFYLYASGRYIAEHGRPERGKGLGGHQLITFTGVPGAPPVPRERPAATRKTHPVTRWLLTDARKHTDSSEFLDAFANELR